MRCAGISAQQKAEILGQIKFCSGKEKKYDFGISCKSSKFFKTFFQLNTTLQFTWGFKKQLYHKEDLSFWKENWSSNFQLVAMYQNCWGSC